MNCTKIVVLAIAAISSVAVAETVGLWNGAPVPRAAELERLEGVEFSVIKKHEPEADGYDWLHGVALCWHKGRLWASYGTNRGKENTPTEEAHVRVSDDGGKTWSDVQVVAKGENGQGFSHGALASHDGVLWCFAAAISNKCANTRTYAFTLDEASGRWVARGAVIGNGFWPMQGPVKMSDGNWLMGGLHIGVKGVGDRSRPAVAISHGDDFTRWDVSIVNEGDVERCWGEATADVQGSRVTLTMRPGWGAKPSVAYIATSMDYGRTWTPLRATNLPLATSKPFTGILSTGQRYVISQTTADGGTRRHPLTIAVSRPGEWAYSRVYLIRPAVFQEGPGESHPNASLAYPYAVEHDGKLYVAYSNSGGRDGNRNSAELVVIPVASLRSGGPAYSGLRDMPPVDVLKSRTFPADYVKKPDPKAHAVNARASTLVSSMAVAPNGRLWATWYCGITPAEDQNNYVVLSTSADDGKTWQEVFVADPDGLGRERPFDPEVWVAPDGSLRWIWADRICRDLCGRKDDAYPDILMMSTIPDANVVPDEPPQPRPIAEGVMMCKPTVLKDGTWAFPAAKWGGKPWSSCLYASTDGGNTFVLRGGAKVPQEDTEFDEHMFVERKNGDLVCYSRAKSGIRETVSKDGGFSWGECVKSKLPHPSARCFVRKLKSGAWLLVKHGGLGEAKRRSHLTAYVSDDEGTTWKGGLLLEERWGCSYPDGQETADGTIYITYDWDRYNDRTIYFCTFTEEDVRAGKSVSGKVRLRQVISQGRGRPVVDPAYVGAPRKDHFWNLRKWQGAEVQISTPGGRLWKTWCADAKHDFDSHDAYAILATSTDGGKKWKEVLVVDPDDFWPRRPENARLALEDGKLVWSWIDRISWNKDGAEQEWCLVLDAEKEPSPDATFKAELVTGK